jgi:hypothetical protein
LPLSDVASGVAPGNQVGQRRKAAATLVWLQSDGGGLDGGQWLRLAQSCGAFLSGFI